MKNHAKITNASLEYDKAVHKKREYLAAGMPEANITGAFNQFVNLPVQVLPISFFNPAAPEDELVAFRAGTEFNSNASLQINQLLFDGSYFVGIEASKLLIELQKIKQNRTIEEVLFAVIDAYHIACVAKENLAFADSIYQITSDLEAKQKSYLELGILTNEELDQMSYAVLTAKNAFENAELQTSNAIALLKYSMSFPQDSMLTLSLIHI